jgi:hypothetical protein
MNRRISKMGFCAHYVPVMCPFRDWTPAKLLKKLVGAAGFEPTTSTV